MDADHELLIAVAQAVILGDHFPGSNMNLKKLLAEATKPKAAPIATQTPPPAPPVKP